MKLLLLRFGNSEKLYQAKLSRSRGQVAFLPQYG